jgi:hypothetical protein
MVLRCFSTVRGPRIAALVEVGDHHRHLMRGRRRLLHGSVDRLAGHFRPSACRRCNRRRCLLRRGGASEVALLVEQDLQLHLQGDAPEERVERLAAGDAVLVVVGAAVRARHEVLDAGLLASCLRCEGASPLAHPDLRKTATAAVFPLARGLRQKKQRPPWANMSRSSARFGMTSRDGRPPSCTGASRRFTIAARANALLHRRSPGRRGQRDEILARGAPPSG